MSLTKITTEKEVVKELFEYLSFLKERFNQAINHYNSGKMLFELPNGQTLNDIYGDSSYPESTIKKDRLDSLVYNIEHVILNKDDFEDFFYLMKLEYNEYYLPKYKLTNDDVELVSSPENPLFCTFIDIFLLRIQNLLEELVINNFDENWQILFENRSISHIGSFLEKIEQQIQHQRKICTFYYSLFLKLAEVIDKDSSNDEFYPGLFQTKFGLKSTLKDDHKKLVYFKIDQYYLKLTLLETKDRFLARLGRIYEIDEDFLLFIENSFHCNEDVYTTKIRNHIPPKIKASSFAVILRLYFEKRKLIGVTKRDLSFWLAFELYGTRGFTYQSIKGNLERVALTKGKKESGNTIIKDFNRKYSGFEDI